MQIGHHVLVGMILADYGANVIRVDRVDQPSSSNILCRGKRSLQVDLKQSSGVSLVKALIDTADVLIDPFRPGVLEKLGLAPDVFLGARGSNPRLVYARMIGYIQIPDMLTFLCNLTVNASQIRGIE